MKKLMKFQYPYCCNFTFFILRRKPVNNLAQLWRCWSKGFVYNRRRLHKMQGKGWPPVREGVRAVPRRILQFARVAFQGPVCIVALHRCQKHATNNLSQHHFSVHQHERLANSGGRGVAWHLEPRQLEPRKLELWYNMITRSLRSRTPTTRILKQREPYKLEPGMRRLSRNSNSGPFFVPNPDSKKFGSDSNPQICFYLFLWHFCFWRVLHDIFWIYFA